MMETECEKWLKENGYPAKHRHYSDPLDFECISRDLKLRDEFIKKFGFAVLTSGMVKRIAMYGRLLEIGAGSGYWAYELKKAGVDIVATGLNTGKYMGDKNIWANKWTEVEELSASDAIKKYPDRNLLTVWPDYKDSWSSDALKQFSQNIVIYEGEGSYGCTGDEEFHDILHNDFYSEKTVSVPQFWGIHDDLYIYRRLKAVKEKAA